MNAHADGEAPGFDPFSRRLDRDIRNSLAEALISALRQSDTAPVTSCARRWENVDLPVACRSYLSHRLAEYAVLLAERIAARAGADDAQAVALWNRELFFECHEWLETRISNHFSFSGDIDMESGTASQPPVFLPGGLFRQYPPMTLTAGPWNEASR